jgi:alpha-glucosidase
MHYTDAPDAQNQLMNFIRLCDEHAIPCDSFQLSSGYTSINGKRYVFNWNNDKVPQPKVMSQAFHDAGLKLAANIKPCLLQDHPRYNEVAERGLLSAIHRRMLPSAPASGMTKGRTSTLPTRRPSPGGRKA